ncbi:MAG TPA: FAD-dependent oxidoreductase [Candidatus Woesebacteria bacterium]|nr:FAD-dependent oxidoreductase [Candidatus Woesebacteria bacterium]
MKQKKVTIVGAGITGLLIGYKLAKNGIKVRIVEKEKDLGGLMGDFKIGQTSIEKVYHHIFKTDKFAIDLITELGLANKLKWHGEKTAIYSNGIMYPFMGAIDLLKFKPLDIFSKIRLGWVKIWLEKDNDYRKYIHVPAYEWMKRWCGTRAYEVIWEPLLKGKFHHYYKQISMAWLWARIHTRSNSGQLGYLEGGFGQITQRLYQKVLEYGGEIELGKEFKLTGKKETIIYTGAIRGVDYLGAVNVVFTSKQSLSPYYWHNINDSDSPFLALIQHTNMVDKKYYGNKHVYYLGAYLPHNHRLFTCDDQTTKKEFLDYLNKIFPKFDQKKIDKVWVQKLRNAQHVVHVNYLMPKFMEKYKETTIYQANFARIFPEDRGVNYAIREALKMVEKILVVKET